MVTLFGWSFPPCEGGAPLLVEPAAMGHTKDDPSEEPRHRDSIVLPGENDQEVSETVKFDDREDLQQSFDEYLREQWHPWSDSEQKRRRCIALYERIFHLQQTIENARG